MTDREEFEAFFRTGMPGSLSVEYREKMWAIETIFYKWMRCELVHAGGLPVDLELMPEPRLSVRAGGSPEFVLKVSHGWFDYLIKLCRQTLNKPVPAHR